MAGSIIDGTGSNIRAAVTTDNKLKVAATTETEYRESIRAGNGFNINSFDKTLSAQTGEQAVLYIKNNGEEDLELVNLFGGVWNYTAGTEGTFKIKIYQNPTGGTLISEAEEVTIANRQAGDINSFPNVTVYEAASGGKTFASVPATPNAFLIQGAGRLFASIDLAIPKGQAYGITIDTNGGTADYYIGFAGYITE